MTPIRRSRFRSLLPLIAILSLFQTVACKIPPTWAGGLLFDRVIIIVLENTDYEDAIRDPYLKSLASQGTLFSNLHGNFHPSYANYLAMVGGDFFGTVFDQQKTINAPTVADLLEAKKLTWKNYAEGYPGNCFLGNSSGNYARKHVPFLSFKGIQSDPARCARVVNAEEFTNDLQSGSLPTYSFYSPNMDNDGHDTDLATASRWLKGLLTPILADSKLMERTLIEITFDESKSYLNNHIYTAFLGGPVKKGYIETQSTSHYEVLRTIEENFRLGTLHEDDEESSPITTVWK